MMKTFMSLLVFSIVSTASAKCLETPSNAFSKFEKCVARENNKELEVHFIGFDFETISGQKMFNIYVHANPFQTEQNFQLDGLSHVNQDGTDMDGVNVVKATCEGDQIKAQIDYYQDSRIISQDEVVIRYSNKSVDYSLDTKTPGKKGYSLRIKCSL